MKDTLLGKRFGRWTVLSQAPQKGYDFYWLCRCDCGAEKTVLERNLVRNRTLSCGCYRRERSASCGVTHGLRKTRAYGIWLNMRARCTAPDHPNYSGYGGRGIKVCPQWLNSVEVFYADMGECPEGYSLERKDNNGGYSPENCEWIPRSRQALNMRTTVRVNYRGEEVALRELAVRFGISPIRLIYAYKKLGLSVDDAIACVQQTRKSTRAFKNGRAS